jgi:Spy/CpxP family protein refolding chaperone
MKNTNARLEAAALFLMVFALGVTFGALGNHIWNQRVSGEPAKVNTKPPREQITVQDHTPCQVNTKPTREQIMQDLTQCLQLTTEQQKQIGADIDDTRTKWQKLSAQFDEQREAFDGQREVIRQQGRANIRASLTPEQQVKFDELMKRIDEQRKKEAEKQPAH